MNELIMSTERREEVALVEKRVAAKKKKKGIWVRMFFPASRMRGQKHFGYL